VTHPALVRRLALLATTLAACGRTSLPPGDDDATDRGCRREAFASSVLDYDPAYSDGPLPTLDQFLDPEVALGAPDYSGGGRGYGAVSLGGGGLLALSFGDCLVGNSGDDRADIRIYEVGPNIERTAVSLVPTEGAGEVLGMPDTAILVGYIEGSTRDVDIDAALDGFSRYELAFASIVLIDDLDQAWTDGERPGADIDAVQVLSPVYP
jgi:hypothetical protein